MDWQVFASFEFKMSFRSILYIATAPNLLTYNSKEMDSIFQSDKIHKYETTMKSISKRDKRAGSWFSGQNNVLS